MASARISISIARPPADVFAFMTDAANMSAWTNMTRMDFDGPAQPGTRGSFDLPMMGRRRTFPFVLTAYDEGQRYGLRTTDRLNLGFLYELSAADGGTRLEQQIEVEPKGWLAPFAPLLVRLMRGEEMGELRRLKQALEARSA